MFFFRGKPAPEVEVAKPNPPPPVEAKLTGIIVRQYVHPSSEYVYLAIRLHEGEGFGSNRDTVVQKLYTRPELMLLREGDIVTVTMLKNSDGILSVREVTVNVSIFSQDKPAKSAEKTGE
jgi:hypothetical protein